MEDEYGPYCGATFRRECLGCEFYDMEYCPEDERLDRLADPADSADPDLEM